MTIYSTDLIMGLDYVSPVDFVGTNAAVIRPLRPREAALRPAKGLSINIKQCVFLLNAEPRVLISCHIHQLFAFVAMIGALRLAPVYAE